MIPIIKFISRSAFVSSSIVSKLRPFCVAYPFVSITIISRSSFISVTVWNMQNVVESWARSTSTSASKVHSFFVISLFFILRFLFLGRILFFLLCFVLVLQDTTLFLVCFVLVWWSIELFFLFCLWCFCFLVFLGGVTVGGRADFDDCSEVRLATTPPGDWLTVRWVATSEFSSLWPKVSVSSLFWVNKKWIDTSGTDTELLWSPNSSFLMILVEITD